MPYCVAGLSVAGHSANGKSVMLRTIPGWLVIALSGFGYLQVVQAQSNAVSLTPTPSPLSLAKILSARDFKRIQSCCPCHDPRHRTSDRCDASTIPASSQAPS